MCKQRLHHVPSRTKLCCSLPLFLLYPLYVLLWFQQLNYFSNMKVSWQKLKNKIWKITDKCVSKDCIENVQVSCVGILNFSKKRKIMKKTRQKRFNCWPDAEFLVVLCTFTWVLSSEVDRNRRPSMQSHSRLCITKKAVFYWSEESFPLIRWQSLEIHIIETEWWAQVRSICHYEPWTAP